MPLVVVLLELVVVCDGVDDGDCEEVEEDECVDDVLLFLLLVSCVYGTISVDVDVGVTKLGIESSVYGDGGKE